MQGGPPMKRVRRSPSPSSNGHTPGLELPALSLSILAVEPVDEFIKEIADFVHHTIMTRPDIPNARVEVEAKIGILRERSSGQRLALPVLVETILTTDFPDLRFESNMSVHQHRHFNNILNTLKQSPPSDITPMDYSHAKLIDTFYQSDSNDKIRVTREEKTGTVLETMKKIRLGDLNIYSPKNMADWRVSVNLEVPVPHPVGATSHTRRKDRMSYTHEEFKIDLTQVTTTSPNAPPQILHELEIEIARPELVLATAIARYDPNVSDHERFAFNELIRAFVNNARILARNANVERMRPLVGNEHVVPGL